MRFSQALGFEGFPELQRAAREEYKRAHGAAAEASSPLFAIERTEFETSIAADHANVEESARKASRATIERAIGGDRRGRAHRDRRAPTRWRSSPATCATC